MTVTEIKKYITNYLAGIYNKSEAESIAYIILEDELNMSKIDLILNSNNLVNEKSVDKIYEILIQLEQNKPIQYILGYSYFYDLKFNVNKYTLIPRQETELLVRKIIEKNKIKKNINIIDIGTGTGCIAISIAKNLNSNVTAVDFSKEAIIVAKSNAKLNNVTIKFEELDILKSKNEIFSNKFDIIVSNPPYVTIHEKKKMLANVLKYEPYSALFIENKTPLKFYKAICIFAKNNLNNNGQIWFEINEQFGNEMITLLRNNNFKHINLIKDLNNKNRIITGILSS